MPILRDGMRWSHKPAIVLVAENGVVDMIMGHGTRRRLDRPLTGVPRPFVDILDGFDLRLRQTTIRFGSGALQTLMGIAENA